MITTSRELAGAEPEALAKRTIAKVGWRLLPFLLLLYIVAWLDRVNISIAALQMNKQLAFDSEVFGLGAGIFFVSYALFELPSNLILARVGARLWIARIMITWGVVSVGMLLREGPHELLCAPLSARPRRSGVPARDHLLPQQLVSVRRARARSRGSC